MKKLIIASLLMLASTNVLSNVIRVDFTSTINYIYSQAEADQYGVGKEYQNSLYSNLQIGDTFTSFFLINLNDAPIASTDVFNLDAASYISDIDGNFIDSPLRVLNEDNVSSSDTIVIDNSAGNNGIDIFDAINGEFGSSSMSISVFGGEFINSTLLNQSFSLDADTLNAIDELNNLGQVFFDDGMIGNRTYDFFEFKLTSLVYKVVPNQTVSAPSAVAILGLGILSISLRRRYRR